MSCNLEQALAKVEKLLKFSAIQKNIPFEIRRIEFEIKAMMSAKNKMLNGPEVPGVEVKPSKETTYEVPSEVEPKKRVDTEDKTSKKATPEFDTLPKYIPGQNTMTYAGIGSRETPMEVLELMTKASAWLGAKGYTLQSGDAIGADMAFEGKPYPKTLTAGSYDVVNKKGRVVLKAGQVVKIGSKEYTDAYYAFTDKSTKGSIVGSDWSEKVNVPNTKSFSSFDVINNKFGNANKVRAIANELHPFLKGKDQWVEALMARNTYQIFGSNLDTPVDFVLFYAKEGESLIPEGGTGQAVEMARLKGIPTVNMADENWRAKLQEVLNNKKLPTEETSSEVKPLENLNTPPSNKLDDEDEKYRLIEENNLNAEYANDKMFTVGDINDLGSNQVLVSSKSGDDIYTISEESDLSKLRNSIDKLLYEAEKNESKEYLITDLGTKYTDEELVDIIFKVNGEMSDGAIPDNVKLPAKWKDIYFGKVAKDLGVTIKGLKPTEDEKIKTTSDTSGTDKETPKVEEKEVNELDNSKIKLSNTKDKDGMWVTSNIPIIMYNTNTKNVSKDNKAVVNTVVSSVSRLAGVTWNNEAAVDKLSYVKENSDDKKLQSLLDTVLGIDKELSDKIDSFDLSKRGNSTYSIDSLNDLVYDMADNYERLHNAQEAVFNHLSSEYGVAVTANHKESENVNTGSTTKLFFEQFVPDYMLSKEKTESNTEPKKETPKAAAGKSGIEGLKSQQGDAAVNSKEDLDKYTVNGAELAIDEYLSTDSTPEASTKYENSIIQNNEPKTKHTEIRDDVKKCLLKIGSK